MKIMTPPFRQPRLAKTATAGHGAASQPAPRLSSTGPGPTPGQVASGGAGARAPDIPPRPTAGWRPSGPSRLSRLLSVHQAAQHLQLSEKTIRRWIEREELAVHRLGRGLRIAEDDLAAFLSRHRR